MGNEFRIEIETVGDLKNAEKTKKALEEAINATKEAGGETKNLEAELTKLDTALNSEAAAAVRAADGLEKTIAKMREMGAETAPLEEQLDSLQKKHNIKPPEQPEQKKGLGQLKDDAMKLRDAYKGAGGGLKGMINAGKELPGMGAAFGKLAVVVMGFTAALKGARRALDEFSQKQDAVAELDNALKNMGQNVPEVRKQIQALSNDFQSATNVGDERWNRAAANLLQFGSNTQRLQKDMEAVKNLAGLMGGNIESASMVIKRALQGQFGMFSEYGIVVEDMGDKTKTLDKLYEQLAQRGGGMLEAKTKTLTGQFTTLKNNVGDFFGGIGNWISKSGILQEIMQQLILVTGFWADVLTTTIDPVNDFANATENLTMSMEDQDRIAKNLEQVQKDLAAATRDAAAALAEEESALNRLKAAEDRRANAQMALELAQLERKRKLGAGRGGVDEQTAIKKEFEIRQRYEQLALARTLEHNNKVIEANRATAEFIAGKYQELQEQVMEYDKALKLLQDRQQAGREEQAAQFRVGTLDTQIREALAGRDGTYHPDVTGMGPGYFQPTTDAEKAEIDKRVSALQEARDRAIGQGQDARRRKLEAGRAAVEGSDLITSEQVVQGPMKRMQELESLKKGILETLKETREQNDAALENARKKVEATMDASKSAVEEFKLKSDTAAVNQMSRVENQQFRDAVDNLRKQIDKFTALANQAGTAQGSIANQRAAEDLQIKLEKMIDERKIAEAETGGSVADIQALQQRPDLQAAVSAAESSQIDLNRTGGVSTAGSALNARPATNPSQVGGADFAAADRALQQAQGDQANQSQLFQEAMRNFFQITANGQLLTRQQLENLATQMEAQNERIANIRLDTR